MRKWIFEDYSTTKIPVSVKKQANAICRKYSGWKLPEEFSPIWNELLEIGIDVGMFTNMNQDRVNVPGSRSWTKTFEYNGEEVSNSMVVFSIYEGNYDTLKNEYEIYFS